MIVKPIGQYTLKQKEGHLVIRIYRNGKKIGEVVNCVLTDSTAQSIVFELRR